MHHRGRLRLEKREKAFLLLPASDIVSNMFPQLPCAERYCPLVSREISPGLNLR
jgi:hypothetical protein